MQKFDILAVSIPDHKAMEAVAQIIASSNYIPMHTAMDRARATPVLLFHNIELADAGQHISKLKALGVGFRVERLEDESADEEGGNQGEPAPLTYAELQDPGGEAQPDLSGILTPGDTSVPDAPAVPEPDKRPEPPTQPEPRRLPAYEAPAYHNRESADGVRIGGVGLDAIRKSEAETRKKSMMITAIVFAVIIVAALLVAFLPKKYTFSANNVSVASAKTGGSNEGKKQTEKSRKRDDRRAAAGGTADNTAATSGGEQPQAGKQRSLISGSQKQKANTYVDSAKSRGPNLEQSAALYSIAVSFNPYNVQAWHGLLQAYRGMGKLDEARKAEAQMREIFGESINTVNEAVGQFGELSDAYMSTGETYRVEYRSKKGSREDVLREIFNMTRSVRNACRCQNVSIHAYTESGKEMIVHSTGKTSIHSMSEFSRNAEIFWLE